jgi:predicted PurR-regulated permease PerM
MTLQPLSQPSGWTFRRVVWATLVFIFVILGFWLFYRFYQVVFILFIAFVMGTVIRPTVAWLYQRGFPRMAGAFSHLANGGQQYGTTHPVD